jgi:hypothetical protein
MTLALPDPDGDEIREIASNAVTRGIYRVLFDNQGTPLSIHEIRDQLDLDAGVQQHLDRRLRDLDGYFEIASGRDGRETTYVLVGRLTTPKAKRAQFSKTVRAYVLRDQRCAQCGRTPTEDYVKLHIDHKIPLEWDGTNELENLQALCSECNEGKKNFYATYNEHAEEIRKAVNYDEPHRRIGELLKAFKGEPVRNDILERVASAKQYQQDWQKRLRELRVLGWKIPSSKKKENDRIVAYYRLEHAEPWPEGNIAAEIKRLEELRKKAKGS